MYGAGYYSALGGTTWYQWTATNLIKNNTSTAWNSQWNAGYYVNSYHNGKQ